MRDLGLDVRLAFRTFTRSRTFSAVVVLTLALGIGANTSIFSLMDQVLLRTLPVRDPGRLVIVHAPGPFSGMSSQQGEIDPISHPMFEQLRDGNEVFSGMLGHYRVGLHFGIEGQTIDADGDLVTGTFFETLGLQAARGRLFTRQDDVVPGGHPVVVLSHGFWTRQFGGDAAAVGRTVHVNGQPMTVIGVAPPGFHGINVGDSIDVYVPLAMHKLLLPTWPRGLGDWRTRFLVVMARLGDGVSLEQAQAGINVRYAQLLQEDLRSTTSRSESFRTRFLEKKLELRPGGRGESGLRDTSRTPLLVLMGMVGLVLLIACANVANLLLARASSRQKEIAVRLALGASRARLVRQLLVESVTFALFGGAAGLAVAAWTGRLLIRALPSEDAAVVLSPDPDLRVTLFALGLSLLTGIVFGLVPALQATRPHIAPVLKEQVGSISGGTAPFRFRKGLVVAQIALSLLLLVGAGLFTRSLLNLRALDPGFEPESLVTFSVDPALNGYDLPRRVAVLQQLRDEVAAQPGVRSVSLADVALMTDSNSSSTVQVEGYTSKEDENMNPNFLSVGPGFFTTLGIPLLGGRDFGDADAAGAPRVAVVNETFAKYFYGAEDPVGRRFSLGRDEKEKITIVGLVRDGKAASMREEIRRFVYMPFMQNEFLGGMTFYARTARDPAGLMGAMTGLVRRVDPMLPVTDLKTMRAQIDQSLFADRMVAALSAAFGFLATLLAAVGLYGVMSYAVSLRTREIGIRMALGAERRSVLWMVLREVALLAVIGVAIGLPSGYGLGRAVESQLFGLTARDPLTFVLATVTLLATSLLAGWIPAARATRVDPMVALRYE